MKNIFVGNLDFSATESSLRSLFEPYGNVERVNLVTDRDTGRSRGFAFVEMTDSAEADRAIAALNGTELDGRALKTTRVLGIGAAHLRSILEEHPAEGYRFLLRLLPVIAQRLENTRLQLLDLHGV